MNNLSYILYFAEVLPAVAGSLRFLLSLALVSYATYLFVFAILKADGTQSHVRNYDKERYEWWNNSSPVFKPWLIAGALFLLILQSAIPSKETIYLIAASEVGEVAVESDVGKELLQDLSEILDHQLESLKGN